MTRGRPVATLLVAAICCLYVAAGVYPLKWYWPNRIRNGARRAGSAIIFASPGLARSSEVPSWVRGAREMERLRLRLRVRSETAEQGGPARILTVSRDPNTRNLAVGQEGPDLDIRLRRPGSTLNGTPSFVVPGVFGTSDWRDIEVRAESGALEVRIDGVVALEASLPARPFVGWNPGYGLALGNELTGRRPWLGEVSVARVTAGSTEVDYLAEGRLEVPERFWRLPPLPLWRPFEECDLERRCIGDTLENLFGFVPFGFLLAWLWRGRRGVLRVTLSGSLLSLAIETTQLVLDNRYPSTTDWMLNTVGAGLGAWLACGLDGLRARWASARTRDRPRSG